MAPRGGRGGGRPPGRQNKANGKKSENQPCFQFQRGRCKYGRDCKFSHDKESTGNERAARPADNHLDAEAREEYYDWKRLLRSSPYDSFGSERTEETLKFWEGALGILDGDSQDQHHVVAKELVQDKFNGPEWIDATTKMTSFTSASSFKCAENFLRVIAHPALTPLSISAFVGTIYVLFGGTSGQQGIEFLSRMCASISKTIGGTDGTLDPELHDLVDVVLKALHELLVKTSRTRFCDGLPKLIGLLDNILAVVAQHVAGAYHDGLQGRLDIIKRIVDGSTARVVATKPTADGKMRDKNSVASSFPQEVAIPGGRHDNDFAEISDVSILPTQGEITSEHEEYLPSTNFLHPHVLTDPMQRYIDSTFRLVRHDTLGPVNDTLRDIFSSDNLMAGRMTDKNSQAQVYTSAKFRRVAIHERHGLEAIVSFSAPYFIRRKSSAEQRDWWQRSPRLGEGTLVCFVTSEGEHKRILFFQVTAKSTQWDHRRPDTSKSSLVPHNIDPSITVKLATHQQSDLTVLLRLFQDNAMGVLVDFNGVIPDTFMPILKNLQKIKRENHIAFHNWILPTSGENNRMPPPLYARKAGFVFPLNCIAKDKDVKLDLDPSLALKDIDLKKIEDATGLDHGQCLGLVGALTREYALIQGPPGTGKSYLGVQLFLVHLLDVGIQAIIRIGGRSVTEELDSKNLRVVSKETQKTGVERSILGEAYSLHEASLESAQRSLGPLFQARKGPSWDGLKRYLLRKHPRIYNQFEKYDEDGFEVVTKDILKSWLGKRPKQITVEPSIWRNIIARAETNIGLLSSEEKWFIVEYWREQQHQAQIARLFESLDDAEEKRKTIQRTHDAVDQRTLARADVIGITTTSLAKQIEMLRSLKIKCVMCEEAGELREADIISALMESVEHFIQIGDHKQLRPQINNFELSLESSSGKFWQLDRSQFERRAVGEPGLPPAPFAQLNVQRRMRPEISQLIRRVYPNLQDHESVFHLDDVVGMRKNLFWLDHNHPEDSGGDGTRVKSHSNTWETNMATALVRHIVRQGVYKPEDVALLTPYTGQLQQLRAALGRDFEICLSDRDMDQLAHEGFEDEMGQGSPGTQKMIEKKQLLQTIRLATVDNFQGEEAKVIIVSLVRSNEQRKVGFLRTENRINVLLSRAQHGIFCGEDCPVGYCQECGDKVDARVDLLEFLSYTEVNLDESPIVVLGCGHFFTGETLDGLVGLDEVYTRDKEGNFKGLKDTTGSLSRKIPFCPDCKRPIRQFATKRYNRLINRAVMDEICKRCIISGREALKTLEDQLRSEEKNLSESRKSHPTIASWPQQLLTKKRHQRLKKLGDMSKDLVKKMGKEHQPTKILIDRIATARVRATGDSMSLAVQMEAMKLSPPEPDNQIILGANLLIFKAEEVQFQDSVALLQACRGKVNATVIQGWLKEQPLLDTIDFFITCHHLINEAKKANLPRIFASATLCYAKVSQLATWCAQTQDGTAAPTPGDENVKKYVDRAKKLLEDALLQCGDLVDSEELKERLEEMSRLFEPQYHAVTPEELASIKSAMVSGRGGLATHSGHWYNCVNGHPFAIGECGMPMEVARCPECGAPIGGTSHRPLEGVSRAHNMESRQ
ncbi:hypothetical protein FVER53590_00185 [Fusarium verticillioides]|nr:hypothetical protein FVER53590_00185 [Fusarium verticillioides]